MTESAPKAKSAPKSVLVECICSNVHLGNGVILKATRETPSSNWENGDTAEIAKNFADILVKNKQVKIL